jgi:hypothetical protein
MTTQPQGTPDWLKTVPGAASSLYSANYTDPTSNLTTLVAGSVQSYRALAIQWLPLQSQFLLVTFYDDAALTSSTVRRTFTCVNPAQALLTVPCLGQYVLIAAGRTDGANNATGRATITGISAADRNAGARGVIIARSNLNVQANAGATVTDNCVNVAEGLATMYWRCTGTVFVLQVQAMDSTGVWSAIAEATNTDVSPARFSVQVPGQQLRLSFTNSDAALRAVGWMITIGD